MALILSTSDKGGEFTPIDEGTYTGVCTSVIDLGLQQTEFQGKVKMTRKLLIQWAVPSETITINDAEQPRILSKRYSLSLSSKSTLRKDLNSWLGAKALAAPTFDLQDLLLKGAMITVTHSQKGDATYANVSAVSALPKGLKVPAVTVAPVFVDLDSLDEEAFERLSSKVKETIMNSPSFKVGGVATPTGDINDEIPF